MAKVHEQYIYKDITPTLHQVKVATKYKKCYGTKNTCWTWLDEFIGRFKSWGEDIYQDFRLRVTIVNEKILISGISNNDFVDTIFLDFSTNRFIYKDEFGDYVIFETEILYYFNLLSDLRPGLITKEDFDMCKFLESKELFEKI